MAGIITTKPVMVDIKAIDEKLADLWLKVSEGELPETGAPISKIILLNLLVYAANESEAEKVKDDITRITADHPARVVITDTEPVEPDQQLKADISMLCNISERGKTLCGEEIRLHVHGLTTEGLGSIFPALLPDLPIYLWTPGNLVTGEALSYLAHISDCWIIDTRNMTRWQEGFRMAADLALRHEPFIALQDLAWIAASSWRELVAQHFDSIPARKYLQGIKHIEIVTKSGDDTVPAPSAILMAAWLSKQLDIVPVHAAASENNWIIEAEFEHGKVIILLRMDKETESAIKEVTIVSETDNRQGVFRTTLGENINEVTLTADAPEVPTSRHTVFIEPEDRGKELCRALDIPGRDLLYEGVVPVVENIVSLIEAAL